MNKVEDISLDDLRKGSDKALKSVYESNRNKFLNYAKRYNLIEEDILDIYQESYIIFYNNITNGKIKEFTSSISTYLISIGKYLILDKLKKNKKTVTSEHDVTLLKKEKFEELNIEHDELSTKQQLLYKHFETLGNKCKELLTLFYYRGYTIKDILELGSYNSENVVKSAKSRCLKTLKERIKINVV